MSQRNSPFSPWNTSRSVDAKASLFCFDFKSKSSKKRKSGGEDSRTGEDEKPNVSLIKTEKKISGGLGGNDSRIGEDEKPDMSSISIAAKKKRIRGSVGGNNSRTGEERDDEIDEKPDMSRSLSSIKTRKKKTKIRGSVGGKDTKIEDVKLNTSLIRTEDHPVKVELFPPFHHSKENIEVFFEDKSDENNFLRLNNAKSMGNVVSIHPEWMKNCVSFATPEDVTSDELYPGIKSGIFKKSGNVSSGFVTINCDTIKPMEATKEIHATIFVLKGEILVRSSAVTTVKNRMIFEKVTVPQGDSIIIPPFTIYSIENRKENEAILGFVMVDNSMILT